MCEQKFGFLIEKPRLIFAVRIGQKLINHVPMYTFITKHVSQPTVMPTFAGSGYKSFSAAGGLSGASKFLDWTACCKCS
jgi:hypothetical protein